MSFRLGISTPFDFPSYYVRVDSKDKSRHTWRGIIPEISEVIFRDVCEIYNCTNVHVDPRKCSQLIFDGEIDTCDFVFPNLIQQWEFDISPKLTVSQPVFYSPYVYFGQWSVPMTEIRMPAMDPTDFFSTQTILAYYALLLSLILFLGTVAYFKRHGSLWQTLYYSAEIVVASSAGGQKVKKWDLYPFGCAVGTALFFMCVITIQVFSCRLSIGMAEFRKDEVVRAAFSNSKQFNADVKAGKFKSADFFDAFYGNPDLIPNPMTGKPALSSTEIMHRFKESFTQNISVPKTVATATLHDYVAFSGNKNQKNTDRCRFQAAKTSYFVPLSYSYAFRKGDRKIEEINRIITLRSRSIAKIIKNYSSYTCKSDIAPSIPPPMTFLFFVRLVRSMPWFLFIPMPMSIAAELVHAVYQKIKNGGMIRS